MSDKIIYIKPDEEITSVIDRLMRIKSSVIYLVIPKAAVLTQSLVNLKLLKREANNLRKLVTIVSEDEAVKRMAQKADFTVSDFLPEPDEAEALFEPPEELIRPVKKPVKKNTTKSALSENDEVLDDEIAPADFEALLKEEKKAGPLQMSDILKTEAAAKDQLFIKKPLSLRTSLSDKREESDSEIFDHDSLAELGFSPAKAAFEATPNPKEIKAAWSEDENVVLPKPAATSFRPSRNIFSDVSPKRPELIRPAAAAGPATSSFSMKIFGLFLVSAIVIAGLVFYLVLPKAVVTIHAKHEQMSFSLNVIADKNLTQADYKTAKIPAQVVRLEEQKTMEFDTTGESQLNEKAKGSITVFNAYSSSPQTLVETTRFVSKEGKIYRLTQTTTIPGAKIEEGNIVASSIDVAVEADQPGESYNVGPTEFTIPGFRGSPKYVGFYAKSTKEISGGATGVFRVLTQEDFDKAKALLTNALKQKTQTDLSGQIPENFKLADGAIQPQITELKSSVGVGGKAEKFTLDARAQASALIFSETEIKELVKLTLADSLAGKKDAVNNPSITYNSFQIDLSKGQMTFMADGSQEVVWRVDKEEIKKILAGKSQDEIEGILTGRQEIEKADFSLSPFWTKHIPSQTEKISINVE